MMADDANSSTGPTTDRDSPSDGSATGGNGAGAAKSLDSLLASWDADDDDDSGDGKGKEKAAGLNALVERLERIEKAHADRAYKSDIASVVERVKGEHDVDPWIVEAYVNKRAESDPKLVKLWEQRDTRKADFDKAIDALTSEFGEWAKGRAGQPKPDADGKSASRRLASAVKGARDAADSGGGLDGLDLAGMSDNEFALKKAEIFRLAASGKLR